MPPAEVALAYFDLGNQGGLWNWLESGFQHVGVWRPLYIEEGRIAAWIHERPMWEGIEQVLHEAGPEVVIPHAIVQRVRVPRRERRLHCPLHIGPVSCVTIAKAHLGMWAPYVFTPHQLFQYVERQIARGTIARF